MTLPVAVVMTVRNEERTIGHLLQDLARQTRAPDHVVVVDGGSTDRTVQVARSFSGQLPLTVLEENGANISRGRNRAIAATSAEVIASTDAGVRIPANWLQDLVAPFDQNPVVDVVAGFFVPDACTPFETAMGATVLPQVADIKPDRFQPSSRSVAFKREVWRLVGGYPEWLDYCEDLVFDFNLRDLGATFAWQPSATVHFRPRGDLRSFFLQYFRYARGDGKSNLFFRRHAVRYAVYLAGPLALAAARRHPWLLFPLAAAGGAYCARPAWHLLNGTKGWNWRQRAAALGLIPVIRLTGDVAKMLGYPVGVIWRLRRRSGGLLERLASSARAGDKPPHYGLLKVVADR